MAQKARSILFFIVGVVSIGLSIACYSLEGLDYELRHAYGGDAYTGIQNAAAITSRNVKELAEIVQFGFGSVLLVMGLALVAAGLTVSNKVRLEKSKEASAGGTPIAVEGTRQEDGDMQAEDM